MKQRISALDLQLLTLELKNSIESYRLSNIYNIGDSSKQFLLKFNKPDSKINVVIDCGSKIYATEFTRPTPPFPSGFVIKLRKHLKSKRLTALRQVSNDRIVVFQFADGKNYLVLEFFSAGNVILLDEELKILSLQRIVKEHENMVGQRYDMFDVSLFNADLSTTISNIEKFDQGLVDSWFYAERDHLEKLPDNEKKRSIHRLLLSKAPYLSSDLLSKSLRKNDIKASDSFLKYCDKTSLICRILKQTQSEYLDLLEHKSNVGYIVTQKNPNYVAERDQPELENTFDSFHPFKPYLSDDDHKKIIEIEGPYNKTLDIFFSTVESSKYALKIQAQEQLAQKKLDDARSENAKRIQALQDMQIINENKGNLIISHASEIEEAKTAVQGLIDQQLDWNTIEKLIKTEQKKGNKIAQMISLPLKLQENKIDLKIPEKTMSDFDDDHDSSEGEEYSDSPLSNSSDDSDSDNEIGLDRADVGTMRKLKNPVKVNANIVTIDLGLSAYANATEYFSIKKSTVEKQRKVEQNIGMAMKNIETKVNQQLKKKLKESHDVLKKVRHPYFFEKYYWFISSEGYLVLMGKSPSETDQIYSKYIEEEDIFVSCSYNNVVWIKNPEKTEIPPNTLMQAGMFCMSSTDAWSKKLSESAWWCNVRNVSKFSKHDNELLPTGIYTLKKENCKNILAPAQLVMGLGLMWKIKTPDNSSFTEDGSIIQTNVTSVSEKDDTSTESSDKLNTESLDEETDQKNLFDADSKATSPKNNELSSNEEDELSSDTNSVSIAAAVVANMNRKVRGKKGKLKKMQKKYKDQDETERMIRLEALGTLKGVEKKEKKEQEEITKQSQKEYKKKRSEKQKMNQVSQFTDKLKIGFNHLQIRQQLRVALSPEEDVQDVVPVFAPWPALQKFKYKVKIQPGNAKKTKSMNDILNFFMNREIEENKIEKDLDWPVEHDLIKGLTSQELVLLLSVDKLTISLPGSQNMRNNKQGNGKQNKPKGKKKGAKK